MKILFIQNNGIQESIGVANISGMLKAHGHQTDLILMTHTVDLEADIREINPQIIAFSALTGVHQSLITLAQRIKKSFDIPIIMGGPHPTYSPEVINSDGIDIICRGEGEEAFLDLVTNMEAGKSINKIPNLHVKAPNGTIYQNEMRNTADLNELPFPDREIYYKYAFLRDVPMKRFIASMGCPYPCTFCHEPVIRGMYRGKGNYVRRKTVQRTIAEIKYIKDRYPLKHVHFSDDLFFIRNSYEWLEEFADLYPKEIGIPYSANIRYDSVVPHSADLLVKSGAYGVAIGLETGSEQLRSVVVRKNVKNEHMVEGAKLLRERKIKMLTTNMIGLPGETLDQAFETVELNMKLKSSYTRANTFLLFPGLPMVDYAVKNGFVDPNFDIQKHVAESTEINLITPYAKEFRNIASLFWIFSKCSPRFIPLFKKIVALPDNPFFRFLGAFAMIQELMFYRIRPWSGFKFYWETVLKSKEMTLRNIPNVIKKKLPKLQPEAKEIFASDRGYL
jgi:anaerobic magnesium-protoporphyrin IX monomethyl ester cyclase